MPREYFLRAEDIAFSHWCPADAALAESLWGDPRVTRYICASGVFSPDDIAQRLAAEQSNQQQYHVQYWPFFALSSGELIGCCGLRPHGRGEYELGFHLRPQFWGKGYATRAAQAVIHYAFCSLGAKALFAGHNPKNTASRHLLQKLGFVSIGEEFYAPTGLYHPSYRLVNPAR